jgi:hypothetical protein
MTICVSCKSENPEGSAFCIECGAAVTPDLGVETSTHRGGRAIRMVPVVVALVLGVVGGVALSVVGAVESVVGKRYAESEIDKIVAKEQTSSFAEGHLNGRIAGCNGVFNLAGYDQVIGVESIYGSVQLGEIVSRDEACK